ncbi:putative rRNA processing protein [Encephalitozoon intestinalis ATCC 50506]|uniref:rRNA-processing protein FYV7 n=1 Tax=Encephalitozoon intestinalis (strain ATCC 50506) TaxID=876142 RepID=W8P9B6_ENCIT|nr:putative rRNA processing protein [Encephalitozoon intestinalis ATCC 50506]AHL30132.1 putative rRNA processing protein [Encephalitozoon intestinalis ATCC 50506]UTX45677.1 hypothetical protein GPK93_07g12460 [Encephalitozoon intestinalis]
MKYRKEDGKKQDKSIRKRENRKTEEEIERIRAQKAVQRRLYMQKTRRNQPVTGNRINLLLKQIEKFQRNSSG